MAILQSHKNETERLLTKFATQQREKVYAYLHSRYSLSRYDCEEIFQNSFIILHQNIKAGKINDIKTTLSTSTYFMTICRNKDHEYIRGNTKYNTDSLDIDDNERVRFLESKVNQILLLNDEEQSIRNTKSELVQKIVRDLPSPCYELLWGFYRDGFSMKFLAEKYGYANENTVKVTKHRCCEKFSERFKEAVKSLF